MPVKTMSLRLPRSKKRRQQTTVFGRLRELVLYRLPDRRNIIRQSQRHFPGHPRWQTIIREKLNNLIGAVIHRFRRSHVFA